MENTHYQTQNKNNYYIVVCKCGHVGMNNCIFIKFPVRATSKKEAAQMARYFGRVKHDDKYAIRSVDQTDLETYQSLVAENKTNPYLTAKNIQQQRNSCFDSNLIERDLEKLTVINYKRKGRASSMKMRTQQWCEPEFNDDFDDVYLS